MFTVTNYLNILKESSEQDILDMVNPGSSIGLRGKCLIATYTDIFTNDKEFVQRMNAMPLAAQKGIVSNILKGKFSSEVLDKVDTLYKGIQDKDMMNGIQGIFMGKPFEISTVLPISKKKIAFTSPTEAQSKDVDLLNRFSMVKACVGSIEGNIATKDYVEEVLRSLDYRDFEFLFLAIDRLNQKIQSYDWSSIIKN